MCKGRSKHLLRQVHLERFDTPLLTIFSGQVQALTASEEITPMGRLLSKMPIDVHLGKFILNSVVMKCLDPALTIAAALSAKSPFVTPFGQEEEADKAKLKFNSGWLAFSECIFPG